MTLILCVLCTAWDLPCSIIIYSDYAVQKSNGKDNNPQSCFCSLKWVISVAFKNISWIINGYFLPSADQTWPSFSKLTEGFRLKGIWTWNWISNPTSSPNGAPVLGKYAHCTLPESHQLFRGTFKCQQLKNKKMCHDRRKQEMGVSAWVYPVKWKPPGPGI